MNEAIAKGRSAYEAGIRTPEQALSFISNRMLTHRPRVELTLRPYIKQDNMALTPVSGKALLNPDKSYAGASIGDAVYIRTNAEADRECEAALNVAGNAVIWFNGEKVYECSDCNIPLDALRNKDYRAAYVNMRKGSNDILIKCVKTEASWGILMYVAYPKYLFRWTRDYLLSVRPLLPFDELSGMEGFAHMGPLPAEAQSGELDERILRGDFSYGSPLKICGTEYDWKPRWDDENLGNRIDFTKAFGNADGCAYALSAVKTEKGRRYTLSAKSSGPAKFFLGGKTVACAPSFTWLGDGEEKFILIKQAKCGDEWWCEAEVTAEGSSGPANSAPRVLQSELRPVRWIVVGPFTSVAGDAMNIAFEPERDIQFERPYPLGNYSHAYWRLPSENAYIRPYRDGIFFGQWFYAVQVGLHGLMYAAKTSGNAEQLCYYLDSIQTMADYYDYMKWDRKHIGDPTLIPRASGLPDLDACGTIGVSMIEAYNISGNAKLLHVVDEIAKAVTENIPRFADGTFNRVQTMWADDLYMSCPFLARLARLTGEGRYTDEVYRQIKGFHDRLWMPEEELCSHIYFVDENVMSTVPWGRGNGWIAFTLSEVLSLLTDDDPRRDETLEFYREFMHGIKAHQDQCGMWHQVLNRPDSYIETSCTAMFLLSIARGINNGWIDRSEYEETLKQGWTALMKYSVDDVGDVYGVCLGSSCSKTADYYMTLQTKKNDDHGTGVILIAACELMKLGIRV